MNKYIFILTFIVCAYTNNVKASEQRMSHAEMEWTQEEKKDINFPFNFEDKGNSLEDTLNDYLLALNLQEKLDAEENTQFEEDKRLAQAFSLENEEGGYNSIDPFSLPKIVLKKEMREHVKTLQKALNEIKAHQDQDVHVFNQGFVAQYRNLFNIFQESLSLKIDLPVKFFVEAISAYDDKDSTLKASLEKLGQYNLSIADTETNLPLAHLISSLYDLSSKIAALPYLKIDPYSRLMKSLTENIETSGGCQPGYAGRFFRDFLYLTSEYLENIRVTYKP